MHVEAEGTLKVFFSPFCKGELKIKKSKGIGDAIAELQVSQGNAHFKKKKIFLANFSL